MKNWGHPIVPPYNNKAGMRAEIALFWGDYTTLSFRLPDQLLNRL